MNKKSQHEIAGFVLIVVLVAIIGLIFISFIVGRSFSSKTKSVEVSNLLLASVYHTTDCAINYIPQYRDIQELLKDCYKKRQGQYQECLDGRDVCIVLEKKLKEIIEKSLDIGPDSKNRAYKLNIYLIGPEKTGEEFLSFSEGEFKNCTEIVGGSHSLRASIFKKQRIEIELELCKAVTD